MKRSAVLFAILGVLAANSPARAGQQGQVQLTVETDQSQLIMLSADPNTVVIGNPSVADISLNGRQMFVHGHGFGETNIMILDASGNSIANYYVNVMHSTQNQLTVFASGSADRRTYVCAPNCEGNPMPGDNSAFFSQITGGNQTKYNTATGVKASDVKTNGNAPQ